MPACFQAVLGGLGDPGAARLTPASQGGYSSATATRQLVHPPCTPRTTPRPLSSTKTFLCRTRSRVLHRTPRVPASAGPADPRLLHSLLNSLHSGSPVALGGPRAPIPGVEIPSPRPSVPSVTGWRVVLIFTEISFSAASLRAYRASIPAEPSGACPDGGVPRAASSASPQTGSHSARVADFQDTSHGCPMGTL